MRNIVYTVTEWLRGDEYSARCIYGRLTPADRRKGYQCDDFANRAEGGGY